MSAEQAEQLQDVAVQEYRRQNVTFLKMVSSENGLYVLNDEEIEELRTLRINTLRICPLYSIDSNGDIRQDVPNFLIIDLIRRAHSAGFAVFLEPNLASRGGFPHLTDPQYVEAVMEISSKWAEIAEEENVEFYSPLNEPNLVFSEEHLVEEWMVESQNLRSMFSGGLVLKLAGMGPEEIESLGGYDYLAFDIMWGDSNYDELRNYLNAAVAKGNSLKQKYGLKGFFFGELGAEKARVDEDTQAEIFRTILDETWEEVDGYCFLGWSELEFSFKDNEKAKDVIREWFSR
ncbi:hypothetical protein [Candidatus Hecatella orcuttiae]|uniref:hypothetical protein n=1 Tax=Candidatus Hecatella orcuttiae TaxID=1935119 RepID=UPI002867D523|nr:hypothetical protein [Candidatus Hecatella orcuttiae]